jgi:Putative auto-transporter adhesin, head GIN domain
MSTASAPGHGGRAVRRVRLALAAVLALAAIGVGLPGCAQGPSSPAVQGSGVAATQTRSVASFTRIDLAGSNNVTVVVGGPQSVVVHADSNLIDHVTTRVVAGTLIIGTTGSFTTRTSISVEISAPSLAALNLSGSGQLTAGGIDVPKLTVMLSGSGGLYARGTAAQLDVTLEGSGQAQLGQLMAHDVHAVVSGSGLIRVTATGRLNAAVPGEGTIIYSGNPPRVATSITGTGAITRG